MIEFLLNQYFLAFITLIGLISIPLAIFSIWIMFRGHRLSYIVTDEKIITIVKSYIPVIKIQINDKEVQKLSLTKIAIWNDGINPIRDSDIVESNPLKICAKPNVRIVSSELAYIKNQNSNVKIQQNDENSIVINFSYLNRKDGFIIKVLHTGDSCQDLPISGSIIGGEIKKKEKRVEYLSRQYIPFFGIRDIHQRYLGYIMMPLLVLGLIYFVIYLMLDPSYYAKLFGLFLLIPLQFFIRITIPNIPKDLEIIERV